MSQYNQPGMQPQYSNQNRKNNSIIYWVIILVLLAGCVYLFMSKNKMASDNETAAKMQQQQMDSLVTDRESLQADFNAASAKIDQLVTENTRLDSALQNNKAEMSRLQGEIRTILSNKNATMADLKKARTMIASLMDKSKEYEARIAELEKMNEELTNQNQTLTKKVDSTVTENVTLKKVGSVLHASNLRMETIHKRRNGKEKETTKAKKVDMLRIMFDIDENRIAESGSKQLYLRIVGPDGKVLSTPANASGTMTSNTGQQMSYSVLKSITLTQGQMVKDVSVDWNQEGDYQKGNYTLEIYNEGYKIGSGNVELR